MENRLRTCNKCGWVYFGVSMEHAKKQVAAFNTYYDSLAPDVQKHFGGPSSLEKDYIFCGVCGGPHTNFRDSVAGDCPDGCTIGPIVNEDLK